MHRYYNFNILFEKRKKKTLHISIDEMPFPLYSILLFHKNWTKSSYAHLSLEQAQEDLFSCFIFFIIFSKCYWNKNYIVFMSPHILWKNEPESSVAPLAFMSLVCNLYSVRREMVQLLRFKFAPGFIMWVQSWKHWRKHLEESMYKWVIPWWEWWLQQESLLEEKWQHQGMAVAAWTDRLILGLLQWWLDKRQQLKRSWGDEARRYWSPCWQ